MIKKILKNNFYIRSERVQFFRRRSSSLKMTGLKMPLSVPLALWVDCGQA